MHRFRFTIILSVAGFFVALVAIVIAGGGHGTTAPASWLFPWAFVESLFSDSEVSETFALTAIFLQFPVYGFVYDLRRKKYIIVIIIVIHLLVASLVNNKRQRTHDTVGLHRNYRLN